MWGSKGSMWGSKGRTKLGNRADKIPNERVQVTFKGNFTKNQVWHPRPSIVT